MKRKDLGKVGVELTKTWGAGTSSGGYHLFKLSRPPQANSLTQEQIDQLCAEVKGSETRQQSVRRMLHNLKNGVAEIEFEDFESEFDYIRTRLADPEYLHTLIIKKPFDNGDETAKQLVFHFANTVDLGDAKRKKTHRSTLFPVRTNHTAHYFAIYDAAASDTIELTTNKDKPPVGYIRLYDRDVDIHAAVEAQLAHQAEFPAPPPKIILSAKEELGRIVTMNHALNPKTLKRVFEETGAASIPLVVRGNYGEKPVVRAFPKDRDILAAGSMSDKAIKEWWDSNREGLKALLQKGPIEIKNSAGERLFFVTEPDYTPPTPSSP